MNNQHQPFYKRSMILCLMITVMLTGCTPSQRDLPSLAGKPRLKINQNMSVSEGPKATKIVDHDASGNLRSNVITAAEDSKAP